MIFTEQLNIEFTVSEKDRVEAIMPLTDNLKQQFGFVHGGVTIALLESVASMGAENNTNLDDSLPFGIEVRIRHRKSAQEGKLHGVAKLIQEEVSARTGSVTQTWDVAAFDDAGDVVSDGVVLTKIVSHERLIEREREQSAS